jgi:hypothetical protein
MADTVSSRVALLEGEQRSDRSFREQMIRDMADLSLRVQRTEINMEAMKPRFDKVDAQLDKLVTASHHRDGAADSWAPVIDALFKVGVAVVAAYLLYRVGLK